MTPSSQSRTRGLVPRLRYGPTDQHIRVSDAERTEVADLLAVHFGEGRLNQAEFDERVAQAMNAKTRGDLRGLFDDLPEPGPAGIPGSPERAARGEHSPAHSLRPTVHPVVLVLLVVVITVAGTAGEAIFGHVPGVKTWLTVGVIVAIVVYAVGMLTRSRAARDR
jgi:uncharacterized membrane protein YdfJ with MMPL/SSD domain